MNERAIVLRYHEIALKGDNRSWFENRLATNARKLIQRSSPSEQPVHVRKLHGRMVLQTDWNSQTREALQRAFGLANFSPMRKVKTEIPAIFQGLLEEYQNYLEKNPAPKTFRIQTRRSEKALPETSVELDRYFGSEFSKHYPELRVDLENADITLGVEVRFKESFLWTEKIAGPGGLPVGSNGRVLTLMSGGLDSPVAAIQVMR